MMVSQDKAVGLLKRWGLHCMNEGPGKMGRVLILKVQLYQGNTIKMPLNLRLYITLCFSKSRTFDFQIVHLKPYSARFRPV